MNAISNPKLQRSNRIGIRSHVTGANNNIETYYPQLFLVPKSEQPAIPETYSDERQADESCDAALLPSDWTQEIEDAYDAEG
ncbi:MAG: hypothetical protein WBM46_11155 [Polyangiales bacterium]